MNVGADANRHVQSLYTPLWHAVFDMVFKDAVSSSGGGSCVRRGLLGLLYVLRGGIRGASQWSRHGPTGRCTVSMQHGRDGVFVRTQMEISDALAWYSGMKGQGVMVET